MEVFKPKVSIVIPVYNGSNYLREAIDSALAQTYENTEILVINDGSCDGGKTEAIALSFGDRIRYFSKPNGGVASALNFGISRIEGEYFSWLSHDDLYLPGKIARQVTALSRQEAPGAIAFCDFYCIDGDGRKIREARVSERASRCMRCFLATDVNTGLHGCSLLVPRSAFVQFGTFDEARRTSQDYDMWFRLAAAGLPFVHVREMLVASRQHHGQDSRNKLDICQQEADALHSPVIDSLSADEIRAFSGDSLQYFLDVYQVYRNAGYVKTADSLLKLLCRFADRPGEIGAVAGILRAEVLQAGEPAEILSLFTGRIQPLLRTNDPRPRVLFYNNVWRRGGVERVLADLTSFLAEGFSVVLVTADEEWEGEFVLDPRVAHLRIGAGHDCVDRLVQLNKVLEVGVFIGNPNLMTDFLEVYPRLRTAGIKTIACNHGNYFLPFNFSWLNPVLLEREKMFAAADAVTWLTKFGTAVYGLQHDNGAYMPNPLRYPTNATPSFPERQDAKVVLCVGRFYDAVKRIDRALAVFRKVLDKHPDAVLHLVGGYDPSMHLPAESPETLAGLVSRFGFTPSQVVFWGEQEDVAPFYGTASLLILTSDSEGFGVVLTEAGAFGLPAVIFDIPGLEDIISDGVNGFIVDQDDIGAMAEKVSLLLGDEPFRLELGQNARRLSERFSRENVGARWQNLIQAVFESESQEQLGQVLKQTYTEPLTDKDAFFRRVLAEYDKGIRKMIGAAGGIKPVEETAPEYPWPRPAVWCWKVIRSIDKHGWKITFKKVAKKIGDTKFLARL